MVSEKRNKLSVMRDTLLFALKNYVEKMLTPLDTNYLPCVNRDILLFAL